MTSWDEFSNERKQEMGRRADLILTGRVNK